MVAPSSFADALEGRPFLMLMGRQDPGCSVEDAQRVHDRIPGTRKKLVLYDGGHRLPAEYATAAVDWIRASLP